MDPKLLILDIDSTLVFSTKGYSQEYDFILGEKEYYVKLRPGLKSFLNYVYFDLGFHLAIWTAASENYAKLVVEKIIPKEIELEFLFSDTKCTEYNFSNSLQTLQIKKLKKIWKRKTSISNPLIKNPWNCSNTVILDDTPTTAYKNRGNLIKIKPFYNNCKDQILQDPQFLTALKGYKNSENVRNFKSIINWS